MTTGLASFISQLQTGATSWIPLATILFMIAMVALISKTMTLMPKTKPSEIKPASDMAVRGADIAGGGDQIEEVNSLGAAHAAAVIVVVS